ncbi:MAG TPA: ABC transporter ATP-binding protein [Candidatus Sabulitectum sp.]|nr:ABC transporter ATP-binding protein [Candidatus Sabulitectum sp.]HPF31744.1 ABC transporter ATP-binding protein [Candidatus Sabulitectum sp.]HPJ28391.1 ABC transporter ATP-binding protein [Candidatus Sabulitectum sp.]HPR22162.1 ABC transporter ATP-binding protein [Candidatus Sabulitectum sp.]HRW77422.1 ABC transporter ATP-binding protein [Candidatus Sabulitectum sp.]
MTGLSIDGLCKSYGGRSAVRDLSLTVGRGEIFGLLGPNGAGKTTTLKMISGLIIPEGGEALLDGAPVDRARNRIAYVPDEPTVFPHLTGREYLLYTGRLREIPSEELRRRIDICVNVFEMQGWIDARSGSYSHGMIQRVVLSGAFTARPDLYVIDEPLVGLDPPAAATFWRMVAQAASAGAAVLISTHTLSVASANCHRFGIINKGVLESIITAGELSGVDLQELFFSVTGTAPGNVQGLFFRD